ncbi:HopJ type III effector protein [Aliagarivorans taiwanensis]|uniref:HopJ type III effector protein n=1 Tax=Aliagarivorans taiwanensis TaxID=561966 RepID=UPI0003FB11FD|nr:HopJ type III effector protein [Aliagarivorans taiwanensis]
MELSDFLQQLASAPEAIAFSQTMAVIDQHYDFEATAFANGAQQNAAGENNGSCKILAFAELHQLSPAQTLHLFGDYYRKDVLANPQGSDHQNIRQFMQHGWDGVSFDSTPLSAMA